MTNVMGLIIEAYDGLHEKTDDAEEKDKIFIQRLTFVFRYIRLASEDDDRRQTMIEDGGLEDYANLTLNLEEDETKTAL